MAKLKTRVEKKHYIDIRISGTFEVYATSREKAAELVRDRIMEEILIAHPSFGETGLPPIWEDWLEEQTERILGIEIAEADEEIEEELDIRWSNVKGKPLTKGGKILL